MKPKSESKENSVKAAAKKGTHYVGNEIEKAGKKLEEKGYPKAGQKVKNFGDKIEHMGEKK